MLALGWDFSWQWWPERLSRLLRVASDGDSCRVDFYFGGSALQMERLGRQSREELDCLCRRRLRSHTLFFCS